MRAAIVALLALLPLLAGCIGEDAAEVEPAPEDPFTQSRNEALQDVRVGPHSGLPLERPAGHEPTLAAPPQWVLGEWWTIEITDHFVGQSHTVTRVVAGREGPDYLVGMPIDDFNDEVMILHSPGFGLVTRDTLGYESHDFMFEPLKFPLVEGEIWESLWQSATGTLVHEVTEVDEAAGRATIEAGGQQSLTVVYDAGLGAIVDFVAPGYMEYHVVDHGFDYEGVVRVPHSHDLIFLHGSLGPVPVPQTATPVQQTVTIPDDYDRSSFSLIIFELLPLLVAPESDAVGHGAYMIAASAPDGTEYSSLKLPDQGGHQITSFAHDEPGGDWTITTVAGGPAQVFIEGIGYLTFDVSLPDGCVVVTQRVHDHGGTCGGHVHGVG